MRGKKSKIDVRIFDAFDFICEKYSENASEDNLNKLLALYQKLVPNWVDNFNELSRRLEEEKDVKDKRFSGFFETKLPEGYSIKRLFAPKNEKKDISVDIMQRGRIIHLSNKIAHQFEYIMDNELKGYMFTKKIQANTLEEFREIKRLIRQLYNPDTKEIIKEKALSILCMKHGFQEIDFMQGKNLDALNIPRLIKAYKDAMYIKSLEIENVNALAHDYGKDNISYGIKREDKFNTLFVMDVKNFGQFSVHMVDPKLISQIRRPYKMPIYRKETAMLVNYLPDGTKAFIKDSIEDDSLDEERRIPKHISEAKKQRARLKEEIKYLDLTKAEKHEMAVKSGLNRKELEEIDSTEDER